MVTLLRQAPWLPLCFTSSLFSKAKNVTAESVPRASVFNPVGFFEEFAREGFTLGAVPNRNFHTSGVVQVPDDLIETDTYYQDQLLTLRHPQKISDPRAKQ